jgi:penicillin amidase
MTTSEATTVADPGTAAPEGAGRKRRRVRRIAQVAVALVALLVLAAVGVWLWFRGEMRASLPQLDGELVVGGLSAAVTIERDDLGIPTIRASNAIDLALANGFLHGQDRFFQMDLLRRRSAGELAELVGAAALDVDRQTRVHRFRARAEEMFARASPRGGAVMEAYSRGVNAGLGSLGAAPFEYLLLRVDPEPWRPEDSTLVLLTMFLDLQDENGTRESMLGVMQDVLPAELFEFLATRGTEWDAPLLGEPLATPPIPGPEIVDIRTMEAWRGLREEEESDADRAAAARVRGDDGVLPGSNNWAVAGRLSAHGGALLANDMHLGLGLPNIWYRARLIWVDDRGTTLEANGVTLPGTAGLVAGSNGHIAWGFTNSYLDWSDLVVVEVEPDDDDRYLTQDGPRELERYEEPLRVNTCVSSPFCSGVEEAETLEVRETIWGPIIDEDHRGRPRAIRWSAHDPEAVNMGLTRLVTARNVDEAVEFANRAGIPGQNCTVADADGRVAWTIMGKIPRRVGFDGRVPTSWADGSRGWRGWLEPAEYPRLVDPDGGRIWTANARVVDPAWFDRIGDGGYALGARARQIRDGLHEIDRAAEGDMLALQLDDRALFLDRWRELLLELLTDETVAGDAGRDEFRRLVEESWSGRASVESVSYRLVRAYRQFTYDRVFETLTVPCREADPDFSYLHRQGEGPLWTLLTERPPHLLHPDFETWEAWLLSLVDETVDYYTEDGGTLAERTWGQRNNVRVSHPLSLAVPQLARWLDVPREPLPGSGHMPRVQGISSGASQRMVVSPGREDQALFHMPGGQSGHPLSPHYSDGHRAWADGTATPLLPGPAIHTLVLK